MIVVMSALLVTVSEAVVPSSDSSNDIQTQVYKKRSVETKPTLYPQDTETRDLRRLDGVWNFRKSPVGQSDYGHRQRWFEDDLSKSGPVIPMPVPSSYNDVGEDPLLRDHLGYVWYDRRFRVPPWWLLTDQRVWLRFSSVHYKAQVWVNGILVRLHEIGHLPFEVEITEYVNQNGSNLLTVAVDNTLTIDTVPQGSFIERNVTNKTFWEQTYTFDFFNYAGIHRSVFLYSTPQTYIEDVVINTDIQGLTGIIIYNVTYNDARAAGVKCRIQVFDKRGDLVGADDNCAGLLAITNASFWWPYLMHPEPGYLYTLEASLISPYDDLLDTYSEKVGIRTVTWNHKSVLLNEKPLYMRGFGMHEDSDLRGKGWDPVLWVKNFNLIQWVGANAFRTSHYPYAEEIYQMADERGIMIIDECPGVDTDYFSEKLLEKHKRSLTELIMRDKNHPSVIMWSISNEPRSYKEAADEYFREIVNHVKSLDLSRPVTIAISQSTDSDKSAQHLDVISFNRYNGWYHNTGWLADVANAVSKEAEAWHRRHRKPVLMSEYGADTIPGLHMLPEYVWSEDYQVALMSQHFRAFDQLRHTGFFVGEFIWNFADFMTTQTTTRVGGNKKGVFTRARQPKAAAHHLRQRYWALAAAENDAPPPPPPYYVADVLLPRRDEF